jgi:hypothetical protein
VTVRHGLEDLVDELLGEQRRALGLARSAEIPCLTGEREQMLAPTLPVSFKVVVA